jgi:hypothetical protein
MWVRFTQRAVYETEGFQRGAVYEPGEVHDFRPDIAERWLRRGLAVATERPGRAPRAAAVPTPAPVEPPPAEPPAADPPIGGAEPGPAT